MKPIRVIELMNSSLFNMTESYSVLWYCTWYFVIVKYDCDNENTMAKSERHRC